MECFTCQLFRSFVFFFSEKPLTEHGIGGPFRYTMAIGIASAAIYSILTPISEATELSVDDLNTGTGYMFLAFGWGCLICQPLAQQYGKRPMYLFSLLATVVSDNPPD